MSMMSYTDCRKIIWSAMDILRGAISDYKVVLYIIHAHRMGFLDSYKPEEYPDVFIEKSLASRSSNLPEYEQGLFKVYQPVLSELRSSISQFISFNLQISRIDEECFLNNEARLFDELLVSIVNFEGKGNSEITQPMELTRFVAQLSGYDGKGLLYNPYAGSATYCTELTGTGRFIAQEKVLSAWGVGVLRLLAHKMDPSTFLCEDSVGRWRGVSSFAEDAEYFDCIVATPPFGMRVNHGEYAWVYGDLSSVEELFIRESLPSLTPNGVAIGVFMQGIAFRSGKAQEQRKFYIDNDCLDTVVALPAGVFAHTNIPSIILKFSKRKENPGYVKMVNGTTFTEKGKGRVRVLFDELLSAIQQSDERYVKNVSISLIQEKSYNILPARYFEKELVIPEGFELRRLSDLAEVVTGDKLSSGDEKGKVITVASLSDNPFEYSLDVNSLKEEVLSGNIRKITAPVLLVSKIRALKPTFVQASQTNPIYLNSNVLALSVREPEKIFIPSLVLALSKVTDSFAGSVIPSMSTSAISEIDVLLPKDYTVQEAFFHNAEREHKEAQVRELGLGEIIKAQKTEYISVIRRRKHDLDNMLGDIRNSLYAISGYLTNTGHGQELIDEDLDLTVSQLFEHIQNSCSSMSTVITHLDDEEVYAEPEVIDLIPRLKALAAESHSNFTIRYSEDGYALCDVVQDDDVYHAFVKFGSVNLDRVFFNIIQNAEKHGFTDPSRTDYMIDIEISHDYETGCFVIRFKNNGKPLPSGMTTRRYGTKAESAGVTAGNGEGGAIVKSTVEHYGGQVELISHPDEWFTVCVELKIPHYGE